MSADMLTEHAQRRGEHLAIVDDRPGSPPRLLNYRDLNLLVNRIANGLIASAVKPGDMVMWLGQNSLEVVAFGHAARKVAAVAVPLNYRLSDDEFVYVINNSDSVLIYADVAYADLLERIRARLNNVRDIVIFLGPSPTDEGSGSAGVRSGQIAEVDWLGSDDEPPEHDHPVGIMIYTSGTTGNPKGAVRNPIRNREQRKALAELLGNSEDDVYVTCGPLYHSGPLAFASSAFVLGATVVVQHRFDAEDWLRLVDRYRATTTFAAPTPIRMVVSLPDEVKARYDTSSMRIMIANAAPWPFALKEAYLKDFPPDSLWEVYGSTELGINTVLEPEDQLLKPGSCGKPAPLVEIVLLDEDRQRVDQVGVSGELFVRAPSVFETYYKAADEYDEDDFEGWHTVGDIAYFDEEGYYYICDRKKDLIISGGMNIYPAEVEAALEAYPGIHEAAVIGIPSEEWGETVMAIVVPSDSSLTADDVNAYAMAHVAGYKRPRRIEIVPEIPKTGSNKILKRQLRERYGGSP